ncbi:uncharacterized protein PV09_06769 [Verruconis gallopava]|uniref:FAD synthase n=1 Tax=Verruconis gallopava TaxID=253628 RepID=A0A0D2A5A4_9PEZI|nr:uncharacterized protein PV09_06769 [Verruconis gallopava]KIW01928.1 hypothetical protein PV09_06769 [Verruconis gallopava]
MQSSDQRAAVNTQANGVDVDALPIATTPLLPSHPVPLLDLCRSIHERVSLFLAQDAPSERVRNVQQQTRISLGVIAEALKRYTLPELSLSYNGGKDCLVLLILYLCALHDHPSLTSSRNTSHAIQSVYIVSKHPFQEVEDFVASSSKTCSLQLVRYAKGMKDAFTDYLRDYPSVKAIFVGTRRTDPHGANLTHFDPTDHGWPAFMRVHPVIDWHYVDVWTFIRRLNIPYCPLYDMGYTSLGGTTDTHRNPALRRRSVSGTGTPHVEFRPAYELVEDDEERLGRDWERRGKPPEGETTPNSERPIEVDGAIAGSDG